MWLPLPRLRSTAVEKLQLLNFISYLRVSDGAGGGGGVGQPSVRSPEGRTRYHLRYRHCQLITTD